MIAKVCKPGSDPRRLLHYLERAKDGGSRVIDHNLGGSNARSWAHELRMVNDAYRKQKTLFVKHFVLSFPRGEHASDDEMRGMVRQFLEHMGYTETPFVAFLHTNTANDHLHIVTTPTSWAGDKVSESHERWRSVHGARKLEEAWNLQRVANPERAFAKSPTQGEMKKAARTQVPPERAKFQVEVTALAKESKSLTEFLRKAQERGFEVRASLSREGELKGISFSRDGVGFKGSQLGRAFRAQRLLTMYRLRYDPQAEAEEVRRLTRPREGQSSGPSLRERLVEPLRHLRDRLLARGEAQNEEQARASLQIRDTLASDLRRLDAQPATPARELKTLSSLREELALPAGRYRVASIRPRSGDDPKQGIDRHQIEWQQFDQSAEGLRKLAGTLPVSRGRVRVLVRPEPAERSNIGFRDLSREQVSALRRDGFEPGLLVQVGERFDVLLRPGAALESPAVGRLREEIAAKHRIEVTRGLWTDGVTLPGSVVVVDGRVERARLVEVREQPFSRAAELVDPARLKLQSQLDELVRRVPAGDLRESRSAAQEVERLPYLIFPGNHPTGRLHSDVQRFARMRELPAGSLVPEGSPDALLGALRVANRDAIREALEAYPRLDGSFPARDRLKVLEGDLAVTIREAQASLDQALARHEQASKAVEAAAAKVSPTGSLEAIRQYQAAARAYGQALDQLEARDLAYSRLVLARAQLDRERCGAYALSGDRENQAAYRARLEAEVRLAARLGETIPQKLRGDLGTRELDARLRDINRQLARFEASPATLAERQELWKERAWGDLLLERARVRERGPAVAGTEPRAEGRSRLAGLEVFTTWRSDLSARCQVEQATAALVASAPERIRQASMRVAAGDLSPEALRRLNAALLSDPNCQRITLPIPRPVEDPRQSLAELGVLLRTVRRGATAEATGAPLSPNDRARLLASSAEAIARIAQLDALHREHLGLPLPTAAPRGQTTMAWTTAWLLQAQKRGLAPALAASYLEAASRVPVAESSRVPQQVAMLAAVEGLRLVRRLGRRRERELRL